MDYQKILPTDSLSEYVKCFWTVSNSGSEEKTVTVLPDGYFDLLFSSIDHAPFQASLVGLSTIPVEYSIPKIATTYAISFKLSAAEYLLKTSIASLVNKTEELPDLFWNHISADLFDFESFVHKTTGIMTSQLTKTIDPRKRRLFEILYETRGTVSIQQISDEVCWTSRQINRYFNNVFGISLKSYCSVLRYRASFDQLKEGKLSPEKDFSDQAHFIREVKKFSGVTPKELAKNKNDRFIQFSTLSET